MTTAELEEFVEVIVTPEPVEMVSSVTGRASVTLADLEVPSTRRVPEPEFKTEPATTSTPIIRLVVLSTVLDPRIVSDPPAE
jgi:hypothetical protein